MTAGGKPRLALARIIELNVGFFGLQLSFGLVVANMSPVFRTLGASEAELPLLWLAGPITGLIVQPLIGAFSDRTVTRFGRRTPYLMAGAILASLSLLLMPFSPVLWVAVMLLWVLDGANNIVLEPYRALVVDRLPDDQQSHGFLVQSAFTGLSQTLAHMLPWLLASIVDRQLTTASGIPMTVRLAFALGAIITFSAILYSLVRVPEPPLNPAQRNALALAHPPARGISGDILTALRELPPAMRQLALPMLCQWYAMFAFWQFFADTLARTQFGTDDPASPAYHDAILAAQQLGTIYNFVAFIAALALIRLARNLDTRRVHATCLLIAGLAMVLIPLAPSMAVLRLLMIGIGIGWAGLMANNHTLLARDLPAQRIGIYMGIFNLFVVVPMLLESISMPFLFENALAADPARVLVFAGIIMNLGAVTILRVRTTRPRS